MQINKSSNILLIAFILSFTCSLFVSFPAVFFRPKILFNQNLEVKRNILEAAGLYEEGVDISLTFLSSIEKRFISIQTGFFLDSEELSEFDPMKAAKDSMQNLVLENNIAGLRTIAKIAIIYLVKSEDLSSFEKIIFPIRGKGLWSTLYGFLALKTDFNTIDGLTFYQHGETPGLGGEIDNPNWKRQWIGKKLYATDLQVAFEVIRGSVNLEDQDSKYQVDGLSGATITSRGVTNMIHFWFSRSAYGLFIEHLQNQRISF